MWAVNTLVTFVHFSLGPRIIYFKPFLQLDAVCFPLILHTTEAKIIDKLMNN